MNADQKYLSKQKVMFVLELKAGEHQIKIGDKLNCAYLKL